MLPLATAGATFCLESRESLCKASLSQSHRETSCAKTTVGAEKEVDGEKAAKGGGWERRKRRKR